MNKVKMFFIAAALVLTTAGVFAGKAKFVDDAVTNLYYKDASNNYIQVASSATIPTGIFLYNSTGNTAKLASSSGTSFDLYTWNGSAYRVVYNKAF